MRVIRKTTARLAFLLGIGAATVPLEAAVIISKPDSTTVSVTVTEDLTAIANATVTSNFGIRFLNAFASDLNGTGGSASLSTTVANGFGINAQLRTPHFMGDGATNGIGVGELFLGTTASTDSNPGDVLTLKAGVYTATDPDFALLTGPNASVTHFQFVRLQGPWENRTPVTAVSSTAVPEPSTFALFGMGAVGLLGCLRRKRTV